MVLARAVLSPKITHMFKDNERGRRLAGSLSPLRQQAGEVFVDDGGVVRGGEANRYAVVRHPRILVPR